METPNQQKEVLGSVNPNFIRDLEAVANSQVIKKAPQWTAEQSFIWGMERELLRVLPEQVYAGIDGVVNTSGMSKGQKTTLIDSQFYGNPYFMAGQVTFYGIATAALGVLCLVVSSGN